MLKYLVQFLPKSAKESYLDLSFRLRIYEDLEFVLKSVDRVEQRDDSYSEL